MTTTIYQAKGHPRTQCRAGQAATLKKCQRQAMVKHGVAMTVMFYHSTEEACAKAGLE